MKPSPILTLSQTAMNKVIFICSPYRGDTETNINKAKEYCRFAISQGNTPIAPHLIYPQFLNDDIPLERGLGMLLGMNILKRCDEMWVFGSPTNGMLQEMKVAAENGVRIIPFKENEPYGE